MPQQYNPIVTDEVLYWFDVLQDNSINNIAMVSSVDRNKVREILHNKFQNVLQCK